MILVVGAGYVGRAVARLATGRGEEVHCIRRAGGEGAGATWHRADARAYDLGLTEDVAADLRSRVDTLVFCAGPVDLDVGPHQAQADHIAPLLSALSFARRCDRLRSFVLLSSVLACGSSKRALRSTDRPVQPAHRNYYEWAKHEQERLAVDSGLAVKIVRAGQVVNATDGEDRTLSAAGVFEALPYLAAGWPLPIVADARYWCAPVDLVAELVLSIRDHERAAVWGVDPGSPTYAEVLDALALRHGLGSPRIAAGRFTRAALGLLRPRWIGLDLGRGVLPYAADPILLDLACTLDVAAAGAIRLPTDRRYLRDTMTHELERAGSL